ncbi:hypothetical protein HAX54_037266, partial [Datura stramonium]|nr:hypothetical protein [Datura stramonium]
PFVSNASRGSSLLHECNECQFVPGLVSPICPVLAARYLKCEILPEFLFWKCNAWVSFCC